MKHTPSKANIKAQPTMGTKAMGWLDSQHSSFLVSATSANMWIRMESFLDKAMYKSSVSKCPVVFIERTTSLILQVWYDQHMYMYKYKKIYTDLCIYKHRYTICCFFDICLGELELPPLLGYYEII